MKKKNDYVYDHSIASSVWAMIFAKHLNLEKADIEMIGLGAIFMDVGKTKIPNELLEKQGALTAKEEKLMRQHVEFGVEICHQLGHLDPRAIQVVESHHERFNGTGYPAGLQGNDIPIFARIGGIVDAYDAMTTPRPYAEPISTADAMRHLNDLAGVDFQAEMVEQFTQAVGVFPVGTLVELSSGEAAVIIAQNRVRRLRPLVMVLTDSDKTLLKRFRQLDLRTQLVDANGDSLWIKAGLPTGAYGIDASEYFL
jgi:putative nucleotidyltransferase with HDIG domain